MPTLNRNVKLKRAGRSLVITIPANVRRALGLSEGTEMTVAIERGRLILESAKTARPRYTLEQLLAEEYETLGVKPLSEVDSAWLNLKPVGREIW